MEHDPPCRLLEWDSDFFGVRIARVADGPLTPDTVGSVLAWCRSQAVRCLYFLAEPDDSLAVRAAEDNGFRLVDLRVTLDHEMRAPSCGGALERGPVIRPAEEADIPALRAIAGASHADSRFYFDPGFPRSRCVEFYQTWIEKSCRGHADIVLVATLEGMLGGYVSCHVDGPGIGRIGLMAVRRESRGKGLGRSLVLGALAWFSARCAGSVTVVTQGRNLGAQRLYQACGFRTRSVQLWYHRWFPGTGAQA